MAEIQSPRKAIVTIVGGALSGNKGTELMLSTAISKLKTIDSNLKINVLSYYPVEDKRNATGAVRVFFASPAILIFYALPIAALDAILRLAGLRLTHIVKNDAIRAIEESDFVVDIAGISFSDGHELYLPYNVACTVTPILLGKSTVKYSQSMGPFKNPLNRGCAKLILPRLNHIFARGEATLTYLTGLGLRNVELAMDSTFCAKPSDDVKNNIKHKINAQMKGTGKKVVGVSPSTIVEGYCAKNGKSYRAILSEFIQYLIGEGYAVLLIPHCMRKGTQQAKNNDYVLCRGIASDLGGVEDFYFLGEDLTGIELRALIGFCDYYVTSRFHGMVSGLVMGVPTLVVGWGEKYAETMAVFGLGELVIDHHILSMGLLREKFEYMVGKQAEIRLKINENIDDVMKSSEKNHEYAKIFIKGLK